MLRFALDAAEVQEYAQLQLLVQNRQLEDVGAVGRRVAVHWSEEMEWFNGKVSEASNSDGFLITYDDGDSEWVEASDLTRVLIHVENSIKSQSYASDAFEMAAASFSGQTVLIPRQYQPVLMDHFQPERVARPYKCVASNHVGSILVARADFYRSRPYLHNATLECSMVVSNLDDCVLYKEYICG
ncbi:hypothetical protein Poli38472_006556 [Pythium oligandrum]|uniref:Tudor domain-containing protein n=1 Tax=Pythium oligandrum TaxID=41045 RepID=A0A8K1C501_PYTOL|nr:hypothetical protein Poli38472_006556 [Pythium oligandrum]|eukprot:TMW56546.1 hypothetical protein Poli38472_006556 [Pythium oligandrum]